MVKKKIPTKKMDTSELIDSANKHLAEGDSIAAEKVLDKAAKKGDVEWIVKFNLGSIKSGLGKQDEAISLFREIQKECPHKSQLYHNLGLAYKRKGNLRRAVTQYRKSIEIENVNPGAHNNLATCLFSLGEWKEAFFEWEWRLLAHPKSRKIRNMFPAPDWSGDMSTGKRVVVYNEQGRGDMIQNIRFAPMMKEMGLHVTVVARREMIKLLSKCKGVDRVVQIKKNPKFNCVTSVNSLALFYGADVDNIPTEPYIFPTRSRNLPPSSFWRQFDGKFKIGFSYAGAPSHPNDINRSVYRFLFQHFQRDNVTLFSLQKGLHKQQEALKASPFNDDIGGEPPEIFFEDMEPYIKDFNDTANIVQKMDLVISVDTAVAHLAGALDKPVWTMIPEPPDYRWMLKQSDTPWYPTMKLFRQKEKEGMSPWAHPFVKASKELDKLLKQAAHI